VNGHAELNIALVSAGEMQEVVVVAYGTKRKSKKTSYANITVGAGYSLPVSNGSVSQWGLDKNSAGNTGRYRADSSSDFNTENYDKIVDNPFLRVKDNPLSTF